MAIPRAFIRKFVSDNAVYTEGLSLSATSFPYQISPTVFSDLFEVKANFTDENCHTILEIDNKNEWLEKAECTCQHFVAEGAVCKHITALMIKIENNFFSQNYLAKNSDLEEKTETDNYCLTLLDKRAEILKTRAKQRASFNKAMITPLISFVEDTCRLGFKIGCERTYIVRELDVLYQQLMQNKIAPCGRSKSFLYAPENFYNERLVRFFLAYYPLCAEENNRTMLLSPEALDQFMDIIAENNKITTDAGTFSIKKDVPSFTLFIKSSVNFYRLSLNQHDFEIFEGNDKIYLKMQDVLYICTTEFSDACSGLLKRFKNNASDPIIKKDDMKAFYSLILKPAGRFLQIENNEKDFIPSVLKTKIYLDIDGKTVVARTEFHYDDTFYYAFAPDRDICTVWDIEEETKIENLVKVYFPNPGKWPGTAVLDVNDDTMFTLISEGIPMLSRHAVLYVNEALQNIHLKPFKGANVSVRAESNLLQLEVSTRDFSPAVLSAALTAYRQKKKYIRLKNGSFLLLDTEPMKQLSRLAYGAGFSPSDVKKSVLKLPAYRALYLDSVGDYKIVKDKSFTELAAAFSSMNQANFELPIQLQPILRDYQKFGFKWLSTLANYGFGGILADDMGLGKTLQILSLLASHKEKHGECKALVVCPASLVLNWEHEIQRFTPNLRALSIIGSSKERKELVTQFPEYDILITSYDLLKRDIADYESFEFDFEIIDEAQYVKNHNTQNAHAVKAIQSRIRFALTGTPIENSISELWSIFDYLMPGYLYRYAQFRRRFEVPIVRDGDLELLQELKKMTSPFILRRLKREVLKELPQKTETVLYAKLAPEQNKLYQANLASIHQTLAEKLSQKDGEQNRIIVLSMLTRLRQICCDPSLVYENYKEESAKFELCMNLLETSVASGHKILVFSQFTSLLDLLKKRLKQNQIPFYLIEGATKKEDRIAQVSAFNQDDTPVFLISLMAGGTGLNLIGADMVIHYDPWWNVSVQNQATDRAHRIGQKNSLSVYKFIAKNTIEEKIMALAAKKQRLAEQVLPDENSLLKGLTKEQILDLFKP